MSYRTIGTTPPRVDAAEKIAGKAVFGPDVDLPHALVGRILRSPHAHARIMGIDTAHAEAAPGVHAVVTSRDLPRAAHGTQSQGEGGGESGYARDNTLVPRPRSS